MDASMVARATDAHEMQGYVKAWHCMWVSRNSTTSGTLGGKCALILCIDVWLNYWRNIKYSQIRLKRKLCLHIACDAKVNVMFYTSHNDLLQYLGHVLAYWAACTWSGLNLKDLKYGPYLYFVYHFLVWQLAPAFPIWRFLGTFFVKFQH